MLFAKGAFFCYICSMPKFIIATLFLALSVFADGATDLDSLFRGNEYKPVLHDSLRTKKAAETEKPAPTSKQAKSNSWFVLQFEALADFDAAQRRRDQLSASTGYAINVVFDTPFYKLRAGGWSSKSEAEDKARELAAYNISAFVVKIK